MSECYFEAKMKEKTLRFFHSEKEPLKDLRLTSDEIFKTETYVSKKCDIKSGDVVIDGGANIGMFTVYALLRGASLVIAVEPNHGASQFLLRNVEENGFKDKVVFVDAALYDTVRGRGELLHFYANKHSVSARIVKDGESHTHHVKAVTIDCLTDAYKTEVNFIKLDVEGSEYKVLEGARKTIEKYKPNMSICLYHHPRFLDKFAITDFIDSFGLGYEMEPSGLVVGGTYNMIGLWSC